MLEFVTIPVNSICHAQPQTSQLDLDLFEAKVKVRSVAPVKDPHVDIIDECAVRMFGRTSYELPRCHRPGLQSIVCAHRECFQIVRGNTDVDELFILTSGSPVKSPPRRISAQYREEVEKQINK